MYLPINDILFFLVLLIALAIIHRNIVHNIDTFGLIRHRYADFDRKLKINSYIRKINKKPADFQKVIFYESLTLIFVFFILFLIATNSIFFTAVISDSMKSTFSRDDLVLMQNIGRTYDVGDIIMFKAPDTSKPVSHRIASITDKGYMRTAGDAIGQMDWWEIGKEDILGKAVTLQGKPVVIKGYGKYFILDRDSQDNGLFGQDYRLHILFFEVLRIYGYVIAGGSLLFYIFLTVKTKPWQGK